MTEQGPTRQVLASGQVAEMQEASVVADDTESGVPASVRRSNFRILLTFSSMQLVFGAFLVGYDARFQGRTLGRLAEAIVGMGLATSKVSTYAPPDPKKTTGWPVSLALGLRSAVNGGDGNTGRPS